MSKNKKSETPNRDDEAVASSSNCEALEKFCEKLAKIMTEIHALQTSVEGLRPIFNADGISIEQLASVRLSLHETKAEIARQARRIRDMKMYIQIQLDYCDFIETPPGKYRQAFALAEELMREDSNVVWLDSRRPS